MKDSKQVISNDKNLLDIALIHRYLSQESYWAKGRSMEVVQDSLKHSLCFGVYLNEEQVGFARVVSDYTTFAWLLDLFILPQHQGKGLGKALVENIMAHPSLQRIRRWGLSTHDAHGLYEQFGFKALARPEFMMEYLPERT